MSRLFIHPLIRLGRYSAIAGVLAGLVLFSACSQGSVAVKYRKKAQTASVVQLPQAPSQELLRLEAKAERGDVDSQYQVALMYLEEPTKDVAKAVAWLQVAAQSGYAPAQYQLARLFLEGDGVVLDTTKAHQWLVEAARKDYAPAYVSLGGLYMTGDGVDLSPQTGFLLYKKAAELGDAEGQYQAGHWLYIGKKEGQQEVIPQDTAQARRWLQLAANQNHLKATRLLQRLNEATDRPVTIGPSLSKNKRLVEPTG